MNDGGSQSFTDGGYPDEKHAEQHLDSLLSECPLFTVHKELTGRYLVSLPFQADSSPRIDRLLIPTKRLLEAGWMHGPIGIEIKRHEEKLGKVVSQCMDYTSASFRLSNGAVVIPERVFIWHVSERISGDLASVMNQARVGVAFLSPYESGRLEITTADHQHGLTWSVEKKFANISAIPSGYKRGNRN